MSEQLDAHDFERLRAFYTGSLALYGNHDSRSVQWADKDNQFIRFEILSGIGLLEGTKVLDVGCGLGDLYKFFLQKRIAVDYTGIDIVSEFIDEAQKKYPDARFIQQNILDFIPEDNHTGMFDYVLASGALSFKVDDNENFYMSIVRKMYSLATKGVAFNMLHRGSHVDDATYAAYDPERIVELCKEFCDDVQIIIDYLPQDFTIYLHKPAKI